MFSRTAEYALRAMACLAIRPSQLVPTTTLAEQTKVPANYLAKVLQLLASRDLIEGRRGVGGGYKLSRPAEQINLLEVVNAVDPVERITQCPLGLSNHGSYLCPLHRKADQAAAAFIEIYQNVTLQDLLNDPRENKPLCDERTTAKLTVKGSLPDDL